MTTDAFRSTPSPTSNRPAAVTASCAASLPARHLATSSSSTETTTASRSCPTSTFNATTSSSAPIDHREGVVEDLPLDDYLALQTVLRAVGRALSKTVPTERIYVLMWRRWHCSRRTHAGNFRGHLDLDSLPCALESTSRGWGVRMTTATREDRERDNRAVRDCAAKCAAGVPTGECQDAGVDELVFSGGSENQGAVVRVGNTVRRPRGVGHEVVEALLTHLEQVGFEGSPRFLGIDENGRQVLDYLDGSSHRTPPWQHDDAANAAELGRLAAWLRRLHEATAGFVAPVGAQPRRPLPLAGNVWTHGDVGYPNVVYRHQQLVGLIDWEFAAPSHRCCDPAALLAVSVRGPRPDVSDNPRRAAATKLATAEIATGYEMIETEVQALPEMAATILDDVRSFQGASMSDDERHRSAWRSQWLRDNTEYLVER